MSMGGGQKVKETAAQKESARIALAQEARWEDKFKPLEDILIADVKDTGPERRMAIADAGAATSRQFGLQKPKVEAAQALSGAAPGSGRFNMAVTDMGIDEGTARGANQAGANQVINDNYYAGLNSLAQMGRGQQADAIQGLSDVAAMSGRQAASDAQVSAGNRAAMMGAVGTAAGIGAYGLSNTTANPAANPWATSTPKLDYESIPQGPPKIGGDSMFGGLSLPWNG